MSTKVKFKVSDKLVKARDGADYNLDKYVEGVDYVMRGCFKGQKAVFRADILGDTFVEDRTEESNLEQTVVSEPEPTPEEWRGAVQQPVSDVQDAKIKRIYPNYKWVETDKGRVWAGLKGNTLKVGQVIKVKDGQLYLSKTGPSGSLVRI